MKSVTLHGLDISECLGVVNDLRNQGYVQGTDFDFEYYPKKTSEDVWDSVIPRHTVFYFYSDSNATYFALRWGHLSKKE